MARSTPVKKAWRSLTWLIIIIVGLIGLNAAGVAWQGGSWAPKLALDLEGGTQIILAPQLENDQTVTGEQLDQAVAIIRQRINASGVSEAEINRQGSENIVVSLPGVPDPETIKRIESSAKLEFRAVLFADAATTGESAGDPQTDEGEGATEGDAPTEGATEGDAPTEDGTPADGDAAADPSAAGDADAPLSDTPTAAPTDASDLNWITEKLFDEFTNFDCAAIDSAETNVAPAAEPLITCDDTRQAKYILGPAEVQGSSIIDASHGLQVTSQGTTTNKWAVNMSFDNEGAKQFGAVTSRLAVLEGVRNQFAIVLDGQVISAPGTNSAITDGRAEISGSYTADTAKTLADQLKFGALPIGFEVQSKENISATLGSSQLQSGLLAGLIGLVLVVVYSLFQYRTLGLVTVASLVVAALITYLLITFMGWREGYRLSLAGVAGLIVAIGITADSFILYFERIRDELRDGRSLDSAVETGWKRAFRTILASDAVNFLAAAVLFILAVGNVRGFALTLGLTTIVDVIVVALFTHPMLQLLARTKFYASGHPASGLDPRALGAVYRGRAHFREPLDVPASKRASSSKEAARRQTIAERKAAAIDTPRTDGKDS